MKQIGIIGLGYVGLPLALQFAKSGAKVLGLDIDQTKADSLNEGKSYIKHIKDSTLQEQLETKRLEATTDFSRVRELEAVLICVPTPLNQEREPDLSYVLDTAKTIAPHLPKGIVVSLESTTYPGTTEEELRPILEARSGLKAGTDFHLVYSPEREDPGNPVSQIAKIPKVIGGCTQKCLEKGKEVYSLAIETLVPVSSCRVAEATKLTENIFRCVNIALVNELKITYQQMSVDVWEVIEAAKTKPFGYMPFYPGPGLGGHCIPIDPFYLSWKAKQEGIEARFIELAGEVNASMPDHVVDGLRKVLAKHGKNINGANIIIVGLAYKPDVDDDRGSPSYALMHILENLGAKVGYYDPYISEIKPTRQFGEYAGRKSVIWSEKTIKPYDAALISTAHTEVLHEQLIDWVPCIVDTRNALKGRHDGINFIKV
tara:strand:+ start:5334 stop:6620 length:1287 start_codon:yes stop_codon:yes gene_type:complete